MPKPVVFVTRQILPAGLDLLRAECEVQVWPEDVPPPRAVLLERVRGMDGLLTMLTDRVDAELLDAAGPRLKVVSNHAVGFDNVDLRAATARRIPVGNTPGVLTDATADLAFALLLATGRRVVEGDQFVRAARWQVWSPTAFLGADFVGATLGIVGYGRIGQAVARRARGFDMRVIYYDPTAHPEPADPARMVELDELLAESDFISLHTPLTPATHHLIDAVALAKMKPTAVLVNTARGGVVDPQALYEALRDGRIFAAGLDVTEPEPIPPDSPLLQLENVVILPHIGSASRHSREQMGILAAENLLAGLRGECLPHCVNPGAYGCE